MNQVSETSKTKWWHESHNKKGRKEISTHKSKKLHLNQYKKIVKTNTNMDLMMDKLEDINIPKENFELKWLYSLYWDFSQSQFYPW